MKENHNLEIFKVFTKLGFTAFGGPAAHVAMMEDEIVDKRKWLSKEKFVDMLSLTSLIPGPNSTEMAIFLGYERGGVIGLLIAGVSFIVPALILVLMLSYLYVQYGTIPQVNNILAGIKPVIIAIVTNALIKLVPSVLNKNIFYFMVFLATSGLSLMGIKELPLLLGMGLLVFIYHDWMDHSQSVKVIEPVSLLVLFLTFLKIGAVLYGSGYVLLSFLETELIDGLKVLNQSQLIDAVAIGQLTPGPVFTTAAAIGYILNGVSGGLVSAAGIFIPSFIFVALLNPILHRLQASKKMKTLLKGINIASLALMATVLIKLTTSSVNSTLTGIIAIASLFALIKYKVNTTYLIMIGAVLGYFFI